MATKKIVWVEDDNEVILAFEPHFKAQGWEVLPASSAEQGKALAREAKPDLIIMDVVMEGEHGYAALKDLRSQPSLANRPMIVFSGVSQKWGETKASRLDALLTEADDFVDKSEKPEVLLETVKRHLQT